MVRAGFLAVVLFGLWILLSGHLEPWLLALGIGSVVLVSWVAHRMDRADRETPVVTVSLGVLRYWPWLAWQVVLSSLDVARRVLHPRLPISPRVIEVPANQDTALGRVIYANSITLTPGTVSMDLRDGTILVHALTAASAAQLRSGEMDRRVSALETRR